jgi:branched-chain amino acid transport system permease protein
MGTLLGGVVLGLAQLLGGAFFGSSYQLVTGYIVLLVILTFKPQGLLARAARK